MLRESTAEATEDHFENQQELIDLAGSLHCRQKKTKRPLRILIVLTRRIEKYRVPLPLISISAFLAIEEEDHRHRRNVSLVFFAPVPP
jgi:hypothetical protein